MSPPSSSHPKHAFEAIRLRKNCSEDEFFTKKCVEYKSYLVNQDYLANLLEANWSSEKEGLIPSNFRSMSLAVNQRISTLRKYLDCFVVFAIQKISLGRELLVLRKPDLHSVGVRQLMAPMTTTMIPQMLPQDCKGMFLKQLSVHW